MLLLADIVGQEQVVRTLQNALLQERVGHAYLFTGPEGVGKRTTAWALARALLCTDRKGADACGQCASCRQVEHGNHPDLYLIHPEGLSIKIEQVREMQRQVNYHAYQGRRKVVVIEPAAAMTAEAANCLLKTLEEPPEGTFFLLSTVAPQDLPTTIWSRCQQVFFQSFTVQDLTAYLERQCGLTRPEAAKLAAWSGGSPGRALAGAAGSWLEIRGATVRLSAFLQKAGPVEALEEAERLSKDKEKALNLLEMLACWYRDLLIWRETGREELLFNRDRVEELEAEAVNFETACLFETIEDIIQVKDSIAGNANIKLALEALFLRLAGGSGVRKSGLGG